MVASRFNEKETKIMRKRQVTDSTRLDGPMLPC